MNTWGRVKMDKLAEVALNLVRNETDIDEFNRLERTSATFRAALSRLRLSGKIRKRGNRWVEIKKGKQ